MWLNLNQTIFVKYSVAGIKLWHRTVVCIQKAFGDDQMSVTSLRRCVLLRLLPMLFDEDPSCLYRTYEVIISNKTVLLFVLLLAGLDKKVIFTLRCTIVQSSVLLLSVCLSVCNVGGSWPHRFKIFETNCNKISSIRKWRWNYRHSTWILNLMYFGPQML